MTISEGLEGKVSQACHKEDIVHHCDQHTRCIFMLNVPCSLLAHPCWLMRNEKAVWKKQSHERLRHWTTHDLEI